jgi:hypothetical protein
MSTRDWVRTTLGEAWQKGELTAAGSLPRFPRWQSYP